jgi:Holliday junction resolvase YEN1
LAKAIPDSFPDIDVLLSYTNPIISATDAGARRTHTPPHWKREPDLAEIAHVCELHFEWGLKDNIIKRFRTILWPSIILRTLRRLALEAETEAVTQPTRLPVRERESHQDILGTPSKVLARHFSSMALRTDGREDDNSLEDLIVKIHGSRTHAFTDGILEYRLEIAPAQLVRLASAGVQGLRKPADTTYDVLPSESEDSDDVDDEEGQVGTSRRKKRRGGGPPPEPESHVRVWMPACMVRFVLPDLVDRYEAALEAKRAKNSKPKVPRRAAKASSSKGKGKPALPSRKTVEAPPPLPTDGEYFDLNVSSSEESDERASPPPSFDHLPPLPTTPSRDVPLPRFHSKKYDDPMARAVDNVSADYGLPADGIRLHTLRTQESPQRVLDVISDDDDNGDAPGPSKARTHHLSSPSKVLQRLDQVLNLAVDLPSKARPPSTPPARSSSLPRATPRPFPMAFEEEESSDGGCDDPSPSGLLIFDGRDRDTLHAAPATPPASSPLRPLPDAQVAREEEESSDDPDTVPAELPVLRLLSPRRQRQPRPPGYSQSDVPPLVDTFDVLLQHSRQQQQRPSSPFSSPSKTARSARDDLPRRHRRRRVSERSSSSIISISTDSDGSDDNGGVGMPPLAPLLIARSRTAVSQRLATTTTGAGYLQINVEHDVIDLT